MSLRPIGWICGELVRKLAGQAETLQRVILEIIDEVKDEFPTILRLTSSNQQTERPAEASRSVISSVLSSGHKAAIVNGLTKLSSSSKSVAKLLQPQLKKKLADLNKISHRLLMKVNAPRRPLYKMKDKGIFLYDIISYPAQTAFTSMMCASYAALIYLSVTLTRMVEKIKKMVNGDLARENSSGDVDEDAVVEYLRPSDSAASSSQERVLEMIIKEPQTSGSIHTLLPAKDPENETELKESAEDSG